VLVLGPLFKINPPPVPPVIVNPPLELLANEDVLIIPLPNCPI
jgi:hypothetical protein